MKILLVGGTGHVGTFLTPKLIAHGHEVFIGTRGNTPLREEDYFRGAKFIKFDAKNEESIRSLRDYDFDTVVDFPGAAYLIWEELKDCISHLIACGSLWMFGYPKMIPTPEISQGDIMSPSHRERFSQMLKMKSESGRYKARFSAVMPSNICGPGKIPLDQLGGRSIENHRAMARGETVFLPSGPEALISPCDAEDLASLFALVIENRDAAAGEFFNGGAASAMPISEFIKSYAELYGVDVPIKYVSWEEYTTKINQDMGSWWHFYSHMVPDITKARKLGYEPKYTPKETMRRAVEWMREAKLI